MPYGIKENTFSSKCTAHELVYWIILFVLPQFEQKTSCFAIFSGDSLDRERFGVYSIRKADSIRSRTTPSRMTSDDGS